MLSEVFYTFLITTASALVLKLCSMAYKSKCKEVDFCCLKIIRDVEIEEKGDEFEIKNKKIDTIN
jgi:hypothetical protein